MTQHWIRCVGKVVFDKRAKWSSSLEFFPIFNIAFFRHSVLWVLMPIYDYDMVCFISKILLVLSPFAMGWTSLKRESLLIKYALYIGIRTIQDQLGQSVNAIQDWFSNSGISLTSFKGCKNINRFQSIKYNFLQVHTFSVRHFHLIPFLAQFLYRSSRQSTGIFSTFLFPHTKYMSNRWRRLNSIDIITCVCQDHLPLRFRHFQHDW